MQLFENGSADQETVAHRLPCLEGGDKGASTKRSEVPGLEGTEPQLNNEQDDDSPKEK